MLTDTLRNQRESLGLTQTEAANRSGLHRTTVVKWESGDRRPSADDLASYLLALGVAAADQGGLWRAYGVTPGVAVPSDLPAV